MDWVGKIPRGVHVELKSLRLEFHVDHMNMDDIDTLKTRVSETQFTRSENETQKLDF